MNLTVSEIDLDDENLVEDIGYVEGTTFYENIIGAKTHPPILKKPMILPKPVKKEVTYDDILSSLNMTIVNGKLQIVRNTPTPSTEPIIHKKQAVAPPKLSKEDYKKQIALHYLQQQAQKKRIQEAKSKKLLFHTNNITISPTSFQTTNHLFKFIGK